jgi:hypothetical protein
MGEDRRSSFPVHMGVPRMPRPRHAVVGRVQLLAEVRERLLAGDDVALYAGLPGTTVPVRDLIMVHLGEARSRAW